MPASVEIGLLGPLLVRSEGVTVAVPVGKQRALLTALLLQAGRPVSADRLAELLWAPDAPPPTAPVAVRNNVLRLRRLLGPASHLIQTCPGGYAITPGDCELDLARMEQELSTARTAARGGDWQRAAAHADASLSLWRGEPLSDVGLPALTAQHIPRLNEMRLQARELRIDADLAMARHAEAVTELPQLIAANPVREHLHALLMLALYRCGRRAEALEAYRAAYDLLAGEVGADPGPELQALHQQILRDDPAIAAPSEPDTRAGRARRPTRDAQQERASRLLTGGTLATDREPTRQGVGGADPTPVVPRQLPAAVPNFAGRAAQLEFLTELLDQADGIARTAVISAIGGTAGVGKTALAVHWAHQVADRFRDGQLYLNLGGFDPSGRPLLPTVAIRGLLAGLEIPAERIPVSLDAQAGFLRSVLAGKRMLIVLDNAQDAEQVRPLLPGSPGCLVVVTSRRKLDGLAVADGAQLVILDLLTEAEARELLVLRLGAARVRAEPEAVAELIVRCARLPLALAIAAARLAARPGLAVGPLVQQLKDEQQRLDTLDAGEAKTSVRAVFSWSVDSLPSAAARMFRLLGLHPGPEISIPAAASLAAVPSPQARRLLGELAAAHLVAEPSPGRFNLHDLLRTYAAELARATESEKDRSAAVHRLIGYYLHAARAAGQILNPLLAMPPVDPPQAKVIQERFRDYDSAMAWLEAERAVVMAVAVQAAAFGRHEHVIWLAAAMRSFLDQGGHWADLIAIQQAALIAATRLGDSLAQARSHRGIGHASVRLGAAADACQQFERALDMCQRIGDPAGEGHAHLGLSMAYELQGRFSDGRAHCQRALEIYRSIGDRALEAVSLNNIATHHAELGDFSSAVASCQQAVALFRELGDRIGEAAACDSLGYAHHRLGDQRQAIESLQRSAKLSQELGERLGQATALVHLGDAHLAANDPEEARQAWLSGLQMLDMLHHHDAEQVRAKLSGLGPPDE